MNTIKKQREQERRLIAQRDKKKTQSKMSFERESNSIPPLAPSIQNASSSLNLNDAEGNPKRYVPQTFIWAGYLPPGRQTIYIYDREIKQILKHEVVIDLAPLDSLCGVPAPIEFPHVPDPMDPSDIEKVDMEYDAAVEQEQLIHNQAQADKNKYDEFWRQLQGAKKGKKKKGKKKK